MIVDFLKKMGIEISDLIRGKDGRLSIRRVLAVLFSLTLIRITLQCNEIQEEIIWGFVSLIVALLGLTTFQNIKDHTKEKHE